MSVALTIGAVVALVAAVLVGFVLPQNLASSEHQARGSGSELGSADHDLAPSRLGI